MTPLEATALLAAVEDNPSSHARILGLKQESGAPSEGDSFERELLEKASAEASSRLSSLRVDESVKTFFRKDFADFARPSSRPRFLAGTYGFAAACKIATLRRFPAGPMDWEMGGFPRSWLLKPSGLDRLRALWFLSTKTRGFAPMFFLHVASPPRNRLLVLEKEVDGMFQRIVHSLELQPEVKGILASAWFFDPRAVKENPHLEFLNRPFRDGGLVVMMDPADPTSGVLDRNRERKDRFERGELGYRIGAAIWPRAAAIEWLRSQPVP
jgi:hypothetical protein